MRAFASLALALRRGHCHRRRPAHNRKYPDKPVKMVVGFTAGGGTDVVARILAQKMSEKRSASPCWWRTAPGASGMIAGENGGEVGARRLHDDDGHPDDVRGRARALSKDVSSIPPGILPGSP